MEKLLSLLTLRLSTWMEVVAGTALIGIMLLIGCDIVGRMLGYPVPGTYEIVSMAGGLIIGLALPATSRSKGHVATDILLAKLSPKTRFLLNGMTRLIGVGLFLIAACGMVMMGVRLQASGEVTAELSLPFYATAYAVGSAFLVQAMVLFSEIIKPAGKSPSDESL
jgi:TRAP-type C4-dicarboxylate transport system permease small subunit